jgi:hypothetical protein
LETTCRNDDDHADPAKSVIENHVLQSDDGGTSSKIIDNGMSSTNKTCINDANDAGDDGVRTTNLNSPAGWKESNCSQYVDIIEDISNKIH